MLRPAPRATSNPVPASLASTARRIGPRRARRRRSCRSTSRTTTSRPWARSRSCILLLCLSRLTAGAWPRCTGGWASPLATTRRQRCGSWKVQEEGSGAGAAGTSCRCPCSRHQHLTQTHFAHGGECILTLKWLPWRNCKGSVLYRHHRPGDDRREARRGTVDISERNKGAVAAIIETRGKTCWTFNYVETTEPLSVYECR